VFCPSALQHVKANLSKRQREALGMGVAAETP